MASTPPFRAERSPGGDADYTNGDWPRPRRRVVTLGRVLAILAVLAAFGAAGYVAWLAYQEQPVPVIAVDVPLITAQQGPIKERPADPGGMQVPDQDKAVYDMLDGEEDEPVIERLLPPPEEPIAKPAPPPAEAAEEPDAATDVATADAAAPENAAETPESPPSDEPAAEVAATEAEAETFPPEETAMAADEAEEPEAEAPEPESDIARLDAQPSAMAPESVAAASAPEDTPAAPAASEAAAAAAGPSPEAVADPVADEGAPSPETTQPETPAARAPFGVQLAAFRSEESANAEWDRLSRLMPDILGDYTPRIDRADLAEKGVYYRLRVPVGGKDEAEAMCGSVEARGAGCIVVGF